MFLTNGKDDSRVDMGTVEQIEGLIRSSPPRRYHVDETNAQPLPSGHTTRRWGLGSSRRTGRTRLSPIRGNSEGRHHRQQHIMRRKNAIMQRARPMSTIETEDWNQDRDVPSFFWVVALNLVYKCASHEEIIRSVEGNRNIPSNVSMALRTVAALKEGCTTDGGS
jgi:hypothetical protein